MAYVAMRRRLAAYLSHEKYGHGFSYTHTELGRQLAILDRYGFLDKYAEFILRKPYPKRLYDHYRKQIMMLQHSALIANEGFAAWLELNILRRMDSEIHASSQKRESFMRDAKTLDDVHSTVCISMHTLRRLASIHLTKRFAAISSEFNTCTYLSTA